jgi:uncharacterized protein
VNKFIDKYIQLRKEIDGKCTQLWDQHIKNMQCRAGCSLCCQSFKILPVEYDSIKILLKEQVFNINKHAKKTECKFLVNKECSIYENRPIICRTHGYPLARFNEEYDAYDISHCHLNFIGFPLEKFKSSNVYFEDENNRKLYLLNQEYLKENPEKEYDPIQLIELNDLASQNL